MLLTCKKTLIVSNTNYKEYSIGDWIHLLLNHDKAICGQIVDINNDNIIIDDQNNLETINFKDIIDCF